MRFVLGNNLYDKNKFFWESLLSWFSINGRVFPWRKTNDPYRILIAEILLQQTNVRKVVGVYIEFIKKWPSIEALLTAELLEVEKIIEPIGLKTRSKRIIKCAEKITCHFNGDIPQNREDLLSLPGVGDYTADAVLCYAWGKPTVPVDTNVIRVFKRFFGLESKASRPRNDKKLKKRIEGFFCFKETRRANLAVLDFGGTVCLSVKPLCNECPLLKFCLIGG